MILITNQDQLEKSLHAKEFFRTLSLHSRQWTCFADQGESKRPMCRACGKSDWIKEDYPSNMHAKSLRIGPVLFMGSSNWTVSGSANCDLNGVSWLSPTALQDQQDREREILLPCVPVATLLAFGTP